ncbi:MAG: hypothetical protein K6D57_04235 [Paludibacteraceae bacterium]|nr:hypothetical protein [Paludibacteraceae bacterium]
MKKIFALFLSTFLFASLFAQQSVTTFLGIPVDGTELSMRQKLINKGFRYVPSNDWLEGEFNGRDVLLLIKTNRDKVWRIAVIEKKYSDETDIRIRFNDLYRQFRNNGKYILNTMGEVGELPEDEDIAYNISIKNKRYLRTFYQVSKGEGISDSVDKSVWFMIFVPEHREVYRDKFMIAIYYDNKRNAAHGEDL